MSSYEEEQQRFLHDGEVVYLPYGRLDTPNSPDSRQGISKQFSQDSSDGSDASEALVKLRNSKYAAQFLLTDHMNEVSRYQNPDKNQHHGRSQGVSHVIQQPTSKSMKKGGM